MSGSGPGGLSRRHRAVPHGGHRAGGRGARNRDGRPRAGRERRDEARPLSGHRRREPFGERRPRRHLKPRRGRRHREPRRPPAGVWARQPALAHRRLVPGPRRALLDAVRQGGPARRRRDRVRGHAQRLRCPARRDEGAARGPPRAPLDRALSADARLRVLAGRGSAAPGRGPSARSHDPPLGPPVALPGVPRLANRRLVDHPEGRLLLRDLTEHATQPEFVYRHVWRVGDLVIWDNRATMHRARAFDDLTYRRELRRVTTLDIEPSALPTA